MFSLCCHAVEGFVTDQFCGCCLFPIFEYLLNHVKIKLVEFCCFVANASFLHVAFPPHSTGWLRDTKLYLVMLNHRVYTNCGILLLVHVAYLENGCALRNTNHTCVGAEAAEGNEKWQSKSEWRTQSEGQTLHVDHILEKVGVN